MILHVDANSFYASCERLFRPDLKDRPVAVLSNNDGVIVALTSECKALGLKRGDVYFKVREFCKIHGVSVFSSNYTLYADMSSRLNAIYSWFAPQTEIYSIDESFLFMPSMKDEEYTQISFWLRNKVMQCTGIPVSVGIAPTKTLAKMCNKLAKRNGGVFNWMTCDQTETLGNYKASDVWGIGEAKASFLKRNGVFSALDLRNYPLYKAKKYLTVTGFNTIQELNGIPASGVIERKLSGNICSSRSFQKSVWKKQEIMEAISYFVSVAVRKMREEDQCCSAVYVMVGTARPYNEDFDPELHYFNGTMKALDYPSAYFPDILEAAGSALDSIFVSGYGYRKAGVCLLGLGPKDYSPLLFETPRSRENRKNNVAMDAVDAINRKFGKDTVRIGFSLGSGAMGQESWNLKNDFRSPDYTTKPTDWPSVF